MIDIKNVNVYGLKNSFRVSKFPMSVGTDSCTEEYTKRIASLGQAPRGSGHDNFLKGIDVQFDITFTVKAWTEAERYHWFDIVSSQSTMHKISSMNFNECFCEYVTEATKSEMSRLKDIYLKTKDKEDYLKLLYNCPTGMKLTAGITTNYQELKTMYYQRLNHRLPEWKEFCDWVETLPYSELICSKNENFDNF